MKRVRIQFSLRTFLIASVLVASLIALWVDRSQKQRSVAISILELSGEVCYTKPFVPAPADLVQFIGYDYFCSFDYVILYPTEDANADQQINVLKGVRQLQRLAIWPQSTRGAPVALIDREITGRYLCLGYKGVPYATNENDTPGGLSETGLEALLAILPNLKHLSMIAARVSPDSPIYCRARERIPSTQLGVHVDFDVQRRNR